MQINALTVWIAVALLGCNTFQGIDPYAGEGAADSGDPMDAADTDPEADTGAPSDTSVVTDTADDAAPDTAADTTADTDPVSMTPIAEVEEVCGATAMEPHPQLPLQQRPTGDLGAEVTLTPIFSGDRAALLTWRDGDDLQVGRLALGSGDEVSVLLGEASRPEEGRVDEGLFVSSGVVGGAGLMGTRPLIAFTGSECDASDRSLWVFDPEGELDHSENPSACPHERVPMYAPALLGGFNPFEQSVGYAPRLFAVVDDDDGPDRLTARVLPNVVNRNERAWGALASRAQIWTEPTRGQLILLPNVGGGVNVWGAASDAAPIALERSAQRNQAALAYLADDRYVLAYVDGAQIRLELRHHQPGDNTFALEAVIDVIERPMPAAAIGLGTFEGGFSLFHIGPVADTGQGPMGWTFQPYLVDTGFTRSACAWSFEFVELEVFDVDTIAFREGGDLLMLAAVSYRVVGEGETRSINVEGPRWSGFFD